MRRTVLMIAFAATLFTAAPGFAFEAQSGGVDLSPQYVTMLANRMAAKMGKSAPGRQLPPWLGGAEKGEAAEQPGEDGPSARQKMLGLMLGEAGKKPKADADPFSAKGFPKRTR